MKPARRRRALERAGLSPKQLAELLGKSPATVRTWLRTDRLPPLAHALLQLLEDTPKKTVVALRKSRAEEMKTIYDRLAQVLNETRKGIDDVLAPPPPRRRSSRRRRPPS